MSCTGQLIFIMVIRVDFQCQRSNNWHCFIHLVHFVHLVHLVSSSGDGGGIRWIGIGSMERFGCIEMKSEYEMKQKAL